MREQSPDTATCVTPPPPWETFCSAPPGPRETNASGTPLVSPGTRLVAAETKATHDGRDVSWPPRVAAHDPSTAAPYDGPSAGWPSAPRDSSVVGPTDQGEPLLPNEPSRCTTKTSRCPLVSPATRFVASDSKAIRRANRRSCEIAGFTDAPSGMPPSKARETRSVDCSAARWDADAAGATAASATRVGASTRASIVGGNRHGHADRTKIAHQGRTDVHPCDLVDVRTSARSRCPGPSWAGTLGVIRLEER